MRRILAGGTVLGATLLGLTVAPAALAAEGFELDVEPRELREQTGQWQVQDLAVGESGFIFGFQTCAVEERLHVLGNAVLTERSTYSTSLRVKVKPGRRLSLEVLPKEKASGHLKPKDFDFLSGLVNCENYADRWRGSAPLFQVDSINGQPSLSMLLAALADPPATGAGAAGKTFDEMIGELAGDIKKPATKADESLPDWRVTESRSKIDDSPSVFMSLDAAEKVAARFGLQRPSMHIRCNENTTSIYFVAEDYFTDDRVAVTYRLDAARAEAVKMPVATDRKAFGLWKGATAIPFVRNLFGKEWLVVRVTPQGSGTRTFEFALGALEEKIAALREACHW